jgi:hypothetical protein
MALVLSERDYKLMTLFTKVAGVFTFAAGSVVLADHLQVWTGLGLMLLGSVVTLAPVPMTAVRPDTISEEDASDLLSVNE